MRLAALAIKEVAGIIIPTTGRNLERIQAANSIKVSEGGVVGGHSIIYTFV